MNNRDPLSRGYFGQFKWEPPHPAPWHIRELRERAFLLLDANRKCVAELTDRYTAEWLCREWNARHPSPENT